MKKVLVLVLFALMMPVSGLMAHNGEDHVTLPDPGLLPNSPLYIFERIGETLADIFAGDAEERVLLRAALAAERLAEISALMEERGADARGLETARNRLDRHLAGAVELIEEEEEKGNEVSVLAREAVAQFQKQREAALEIFMGELNSFLVQKEALLEELREAARSGDSDEVRRIQESLRELEGVKDAAEGLKDATLSAIADRKEQLHDNLEPADEIAAEAQDRAQEQREASEDRLQEAKENALDAQQNAIEAQERVNELLQEAGERASEAQGRGQ